VTAAAGYPATTVNVTIPATPGYQGGTPVSGPLTVVGRASPSGPLDHITQKSGRWPTRLGEIDDNDLSGTRGSVGLLQTITVTDLPDRPKLAIVGWGSLAAQDDAQNAWALPGTITALERAGAPRQEQMLYTFRRASTVAQVGADLAELRAALPAGAIIGHAVALSSETWPPRATGSTRRRPSRMPLWPCCSRR
jgi:putative ABC transport system permease protein